MLVDPAHRLVAAGLEAEWNARLADVAAAEEELARFRAQTKDQLTDDMRCRVIAMCTDLSRLWEDPAVVDREPVKFGCDPIQSFGAGALYAGTSHNYTIIGHAKASLA
jgi:hypothetical protein